MLFSWRRVTLHTRLHSLVLLLVLAHLLVHLRTERSYLVNVGRILQLALTIGVCTALACRRRSKVIIGAKITVLLYKVRWSLAITCAVGIILAGSAWIRLHVDIELCILLIPAGFPATLLICRVLICRVLLVLSLRLSFLFLLLAIPLLRPLLAIALLALLPIIRNRFRLAFSLGAMGLNVLLWPLVLPLLVARSLLVLFAVPELLVQRAPRGKVHLAPLPVQVPLLLLLLWLLSIGPVLLWHRLGLCVQVEAHFPGGVLAVPGRLWWIALLLWLLTLQTLQLRVILDLFGDIPHPVTLAHTRA
mmetsp:Transcript_105215/g.339372  ORF Transcript_105215/g.339372 Transcript_105215/m.339372 type:complete len:304 (-) Transcript_105215:90-1001(-)